MSRNKDARSSEQWEQFQNRFVVDHPEVDKEELLRMDDAFATFERLSDDMQLPFIAWCIVKGRIQAHVLAGQVQEIIEGHIAIKSIRTNKLAKII